MPTYEITSPDGHTYEVTAPQGASQQDVLAYAQQHHADNPPTASVPAWQRNSSPVPEHDLIGALRKADAAGDTQGAQRIAQMIKDQRATAGPRATGTTIYSVRGPDGQIHDFQGPDGASPDQVLAAARAQFGGDKPPAPPQQSPQDAARAAGQAAGEQEGGLMAGIRGAASSGTFGLSDYVNAAARYAGQRLTGVQHPDDFSTDLAYVKGQDEGAAGAHPYANMAGQVAGALVPGAGLAKVGTKLAPRAVQAALEFKAGQPVANLLRVIGHGAIGGGAYGGIQGGANAAENGGSAGDIASGAAGGAATGAVAGAVAGPLGAGVAKGVRAVADQFAPVASRSIKVLADKLDMDPAVLGKMLTEFRGTTGRAPTIADVLAARQQANLQPITTTEHQSAARMLDAQQAGLAALPQRVSATIAGGGSTATPFDGANLGTARVGDLRNSQSQIMSEIMGNRDDPTALRNQPGALDPDVADILNGPHVRDAVADDIYLRRKLADQPETLTVDDFERLRHGLRAQQTARMSPTSPRYSPQAAGDYGQTADALSDFAAQQHPDYGHALAAYGAQERFINAFQHASSGKSLLDAADMSDIRSFDTPEGRAGLELGARSRLVQQAAESESGATKVADQLRQGAPSRTLESLPSAEQSRLQRMGAAETRSQQSYRALTTSSLVPNDQAAQQSIKSATEGGVAMLGHTLTGFKAHAAYRLLVARGVRADTANEIVGQLTRSRTPQDVAELTTMLNKARIGADARRLILKQVARYAGAAAGSMSNQIVEQSQ